MSLINDLSNAGIIEKQEAIELNKKIGEKDLESKDILEILYRYFMQKISGGSEFGSIYVSVGPLEKRDKENHHDSNNEHSELLEILYNKNIIPEIVYQKIKPFPYKADQSSYFLILHLSMKLMSFNRSFTIENQLAFATLLGGKSPYGGDSMLNANEKKKLIQDIKAKKLDTYLDFFKYCYGCRIVNLLSYRGKERNLLKEVVKKLNQLCYSAFTITEITSYDEDFTGEPSYDNKQTTIVVNTGAREHRYTYTFFQNEDKNQNNNKLNLLLENLLLMANQLLAGFNATYRLSGITNQLIEGLFPNSRAEFAICRFEPENSNIFDSDEMRKRFLLNRPFPLFIRFPLSYLHIEYVVYHFKKCGLLAHIDDERYEDILGKVYETTYDHVADLLAIFPVTVAATNRKVSAGKKPYKEFLLTLNQISHGVLNFTDIYDGTPEDFTYETEVIFKVSFKCNGEYHEIDCDLIGKEFNDNLVYYIINEIVRKKYTGYRLLQLINGKHEYDTYLFVSNQQSEYLKSMKLIEVMDRF
jgi:hypothetical protein